MLGSLKKSTSNSTSNSTIFCDHLYKLCTPEIYNIHQKGLYFYTKRCYRSVKTPSTPLNLNFIKNFMNVSKGSMTMMGKFMKSELSSRLAQRVVDLASLPGRLSEDNSVTEVRSLYIDSMRRIHSFDIETYEDAIAFSSVIDDVKKRHGGVAEDISRSVQTLKSTCGEDSVSVDGFLDRFYMSRIGIRMLIGHYLSVTKGHPSIVETECSPYSIIKDSIIDCEELCLINYGTIPKIKITGNPEYTFTYIPSHIYYITLELLKNSARSIVENKSELFSQQQTNGEINVMISEGEDDLIIKISDTGGGFPRSKLKDVFSYSYTTANMSSGRIPIAGFGHGLPLSLQYARYFGGDLQLIPFYGVGTDAIVYINKLGNSSEMLP